MQLKLTIFLPRRVFWLNVGVAVCCNELLRQTYNLGSGVGVSVLQLLRIFEKTTGTTVPYEMKPRREGDIISIYSDGTRAKQELGWTTRYSLEQMCEDFWRWQTMNPDGYRNAGAASNASIGSTLKAEINGNH